MRLISNHPETPYFQPPPLHISVLKPCDQLRVISWDGKEGVTEDVITKCNKVAAISDGAEVTLFQQFVSKV